MTEAENAHRQLYHITDNLLRQLGPRPGEALEFLNDISLLLYVLAAEQAEFISLLESEERQKLTEMILDMHTEVRQLDYKFGRVIERINNDDWRVLVSCLKELFLSRQGKESVGDLFDHLLQNMYDKRNIGNFITPQTLADMMAAMLKPKSGELVIDPVCGCGRLLVSAARSCGDCAYIGNDIDEQIRTTAFFNLIFHGITNAKIHQRNFLEDVDEEKGDLILANPPYNENLYETAAFVGRIMKVLKKGGRCGILVPEGFLTNVVNHDVVKMRQDLLCNHSLEGVISLPRKIYKPYTSSKSSLILLKKKPASSKHRTFFSCVSEYDGPENEFADTVYEQNMREIVEVWELWNKKQPVGSIGRNTIFWWASSEEIIENEYIFGADQYRRSEYMHMKSEWKVLSEHILAGQNELENSIAHYFREDSVI